MGTTIQYKKELFDLINALTSISPSIGFELIDDEVVVRKSDDERTIPYRLSAPIEYFSIPSTVAFYNYPNFYSFIDMTKNAKLTLDDNMIIVKGDSVKVKYMLSEEGDIINGPSEIAFNDPDVEFTLSRDDLDEIVKMSGFIKPKSAKVSCTSDGVFFTMYTDETDHSFVKEFVAERTSDYEDDIDFEILADRFSHLPSKRDYLVSIKKEKYIMFTLIHDEIKLSIFSGENA